LRSHEDERSGQRLEEEVQAAGEGDLVWK